MPVTHPAATRRPATAGETAAIISRFRGAAEALTDITATLAYLTLPAAGRATAARRLDDFDGQIALLRGELRRTAIPEGAAA